MARANTASPTSRNHVDRSSPRRDGKATEWLGADRLDTATQTPKTGSIAPSPEKDLRCCMQPLSVHFAVKEASCRPAISHMSRGRTDLNVFCSSVLSCRTSWLKLRGTRCLPCCWVACVPGRRQKPRNPAGSAAPPGSSSGSPLISGRGTEKGTAAGPATRGPGPGPAAAQ